MYLLTYISFFLNIYIYIAIYVWIHLHTGWTDVQNVTVCLAKPFEKDC
jgi:hypothetical protein